MDDNSAQPVAIPATAAKREAAQLFASQSAHTNWFGGGAVHLLQH